MNGPRGWRAPRWESSPQRPPVKSILPEKMVSKWNETKNIPLEATCSKFVRERSLTTGGPESPPGVHSRSTQAEEDNPNVAEKGLPEKIHYTTRETRKTEKLDTVARRGGDATPDKTAA